MPMKKDIDDISREEDFRDFDDRNIDDGWPYADETGSASGPVDNAEYGKSGQASEKGRNPGFLVENADFDGAEPPQRDRPRPGTIGLEESDDLEERLSDRIDALGVIDMDLIDIHVDGHVATLEGQIDDAATARKILAAAQAVAGVRQVRNHLRLAGVDSRIPDED